MPELPEVETIKRGLEPLILKKKIVQVDIDTQTRKAFQGDEKDVVLFSTAIKDHTHAGTYPWLKNNKELINVATSRAREKLIVLSDTENLARLHQKGEEDDLFELVEYVKKNG